MLFQSGPTHPSPVAFLDDLWTYHSDLKMMGAQTGRRMVAVRPGIRASRLFRMLIRDRQALIRSLDLILACDFDRVVMSHCSIVEKGGKAAIRGLRQRFAG